MGGLAGEGREGQRHPEPASPAPVRRAAINVHSEEDGPGRLSALATMVTNITDPEIMQGTQFHVNHREMVSRPEGFPARQPLLLTSVPLLECSLLSSVPAFQGGGEERRHGSPPPADMALLSLPLPRLRSLELDLSDLDLSGSSIVEVLKRESRTVE